jgi:hypothetical protein
MLDNNYFCMYNDALQYSIFIVIQIIIKLARLYAISQDYY